MNCISFLKKTLNILILFFLFNYTNNYIVLPFKSTNILYNKENEVNLNPIDDFLFKIDLNKIYTSISLGKPAKNIDFYFTMEKFISSIDSNICLKDSKSSYNPSNSKSYKKIKRDLDNSILSNEKCSIYNDLDLNENITFDKFEFYLRENPLPLEKIKIIEPDKFCGEIGLRRFSSNSIIDKNSFIYNLKKNNIINSYSWGIFFFNIDKFHNIDDESQDQYDGFFIAGVNLDDNIDIFDTELFRSVYAEPDSLFWTLNFDRIFYYYKINNTIEYISTNNTRAELIVDLNYIVSDEIYYNLIKKYYFQEFFDNNTCYEEKSYKENEGNTYMIICDISFKKYKHSFPGFYLYSEQLISAFNLYQEDVFYEYNNKIYFLIIHKDSVKNYWKLGKIFLKKYPFMFDYDKKIISYVILKKGWKPKNNTKIHKKDVKIEKQYKNIKEYILLILLFVGIIIGVLLGKRIWNKNNKLKANELEQNYKYIEQDRDKKGAQINSLGLFNH